MGPRDLLDRRRDHHVDRRRRTPTTSPWPRGTSRSRRSTWTSPTTRCSRRSGDGRWRGRGGRQLRRLSSQLVETLQQKGIRDLSVLRAVGRCPVTCSSPRASATAPTRTRRCRSGAARRSRSHGCRHAISSSRRSPAGSGCSRSAPARATRRRCSPSSPAACSRSSASRRLAQNARAALEAAGIRNVTVLVGDGTLGWRPFAPYDAILVAAASPEVPAPLMEQLAPGGRMVIPIGDRHSQVADAGSAGWETTADEHRRRRPLRPAARRVRLSLSRRFTSGAHAWNC